MTRATAAQAPRNVLIVLMGSLGDVVRGLALVDACKAAWSECSITWLVEPACAGIVRLHPRIDRVVVFERSRGLAGVLNLRRELRRERFDVTLDLQRHLKSGIFSWLSGAKRRVGFNPKDTKECNWLFNTEFIAESAESIPKVEHYLKFLGVLGIPVPEQLSSGLEHITLANISADWKGELSEPYLGLVLGSSWDSKDWPEEGYAGLLGTLEAEGLRSVVLLGDRSKVEMAARLEASATALKIVNLAGKTTLKELVGVLQGARVCVGPDSGPAHICGAVGTRHITLFGPTPMIRNAPRGSEELSLSSLVGCSPCKRRICPGLNKVCMRLISPESVLQRIGDVISEKRP